MRKVASIVGIICSFVILSGFSFADRAYEYALNHSTTEVLEKVKEDLNSYLPEQGEWKEWKDNCKEITVTEKFGIISRERTVAKLVYEQSKELSITKGEIFACYAILESDADKLEPEFIVLSSPENFLKQIVLTKNGQNWNMGAVDWTDIRSGLKSLEQVSVGITQ